MLNISSIQQCFDMINCLIVYPLIVLLYKFDPFRQNQCFGKVIF